MPIQKKFLQNQKRSCQVHAKTQRCIKCSHGPLSQCGPLKPLYLIWQDCYNCVAVNCTLVYEYHIPYLPIYYHTCRMVFVELTFLIKYD